MSVEGDSNTISSLERIAREQAIDQLRRRNGLMKTLGSENGEPKLDWVEGVARLLQEEHLLEEVETDARAIHRRGVRHLIWTGMGGSVITVHVLCAMGFAAAGDLTLYPLDSTDPAALNHILETIARQKNLTPPFHDAATLHTLLEDVMMVGVSMGMTSEEPITHLTWFVELLQQAQLTPSEHIQVMTLPGSFLDQFAQQQEAPRRPLQPDGGTGTGGRMSAPTTRVFLLPVALYLTYTHSSSSLRSILADAWRHHKLDLAQESPDKHPFVQLAATLSDASQNGACRLLLEVTEEWKPLLIWIEQLMEESLGKGGKGIVVFDEQPLNPQGPCFATEGIVHVRMTADEKAETSPTFQLCLPYLATRTPEQRLSALASCFLGWQLTMSLYGYLQQITFAGQPAVENYKARARQLRSLSDPLEEIQNWKPTLRYEQLRLLTPAFIEPQETPAATFVHALRQRAYASPQELDYLDVTINGFLPENTWLSISAAAHKAGNMLLGIPVKVRQAPAAYHSTEQSEMDGPDTFVSLRILIRDHESVIAGAYTDAFLRAQAIGTWQAMLEQKRLCFLLIIDGSLQDASAPLEHFFEQTIQLLQPGE